MAGLSINQQSTIAFKNLLNKSHTDLAKGLGNESEDIKFNVHSDTIFVSTISSTPATAISAGIAVLVQADLTLDGSSNGHAYFATWPVLPPAGVDPTTLSAYAYGAGLLLNIVAGDRVKNAISFAYGNGYEVIPYAGTPIPANRIFVNDPRNWVYQYQSGVFFQENLGTIPATLEVYAYTGQILSNVIGGGTGFVPLGGTTPGFPVLGDIEVTDGFKMFLNTSPATYIQFNNSLISPAIPTIEIAGNMLLNGDLIVQGTTVTLNEQTVQILDNNLVINFGGTHSTALGGGITVEDGILDGIDSTLLLDANGRWQITPGFDVFGLANYDIDRSASYTNRSLVDKEYVDSVTGGTSAGNITVAATYIGTGGSPVMDSYTGVAIPTQLGYDQASIYLVTFNSDNSGPAKLSIDGLPYIELLKGDEILGLISLEAGDIQASVVYYVVYDGVQLQLFSLNPVQAPGTYTNLSPSTIAVGGIPVGTTFNNMTYTQLFNMMFYPYSLPVFGSFLISGQGTTLEVGQAIAAGAKTFLWTTTNPLNIVLSSIVVRDLTGGVILSSNTKATQTVGPLVIGRVYTIVNYVLGDNFLNVGASSNTVGTRFTAIGTTPTVWTNASTIGYDDGTEVINFASPITKVVQTSNTWRISATRSNSSTFSRDFSTFWYWRVFSGTSTNLTLTAPQVQALTNSALQASVATTIQYVAGGYKYYGIPSTFGFPSLFKDVNTNLNVAMAGIAEGYTSTNGNGIYYQSVSITNAYGVVNNYRIYRTRNVLGGAIKIAIS